MRLLLAVIFAWAPIVFAQEQPSQSAPYSEQAFPLLLRDGEPREPLLTHHSPWHLLQQMDDAERANSSVYVELPAHAGNEASLLARSAEQLWKEGQHDEALGKLLGLASIHGGNNFALGISYHIPPASRALKNSAATSRIGTRDSLTQTILLRDSVSGNLFALLRGKGDGEGNWWTVNYSHDQGATWQETYQWTSSSSISSIAAALAGKSLYVVYTGGDPGLQELRQRRFLTSDGTVELYSDSSAYRMVTTLTGIEKIVEVGLTSNNEYANDRLYVGVITSQGRLPIFWNTLDTTSWRPLPSYAIRTASEGLSMAYNYTSTPYFLWFSFIDTGAVLNLDGLSNDSLITPFTEETSGSYFSSVGAHLDTIFCTFEDYSTRWKIMYGITYGISPPSFYYGYIGDTSIASESPAVTLDHNGGIGVIGRFITTPREGRFQWRHYDKGSWSKAQAFTLYEPAANQPSIVYMGGETFGILYLSSSSPQTRAAFFATTSVATDAPELVAEQPGAFALQQNYPNPFNPVTQIDYTIGQEKDLGTWRGGDLGRNVLVQLIVYDVLGREVKTLVTEVQRPGSYKVRFDGARLASGVYLYRLKAGNYSSVRKMVLMK